MRNEAPDLIAARLEINAPSDWYAHMPERPLVIIANHPFAIADGHSILAVAKQMGTISHTAQFQFHASNHSQLPLIPAAIADAVDCFRVWRPTAGGMKSHS